MVAEKVGVGVSDYHAVLLVDYLVAIVGKASIAGFKSGVRAVDVAYAQACGISFVGSGKHAFKTVAVESAQRLPFGRKDLRSVDIGQERAVVEFGYAIAVMADCRSDVDFPVGKVEGAYIRCKIYAGVVQFAAVAPEVFEPRFFMERRAYEQVGGMRFVEIEIKIPAVAEETHVETDTEGRRRLPFEAVVAQIGKDRAESMTEQSDRHDVGAGGIVGQIAVSGHFPAETNFGKIDKRQFFHEIFR